MKQDATWVLKDPRSVYEVHLKGKKLLIMQILVEQAEPMTVYQVAKKSDGAVSLGEIYTYIDRLEKAGLISSKYVKEGRIKKRYVSAVAGSFQK